MAKQLTEHKPQKLTQLLATAICGNDISSSCLYVSALSIMYAGKLAPVALLMVAAVLFFFRGIYGEVVGALPLNGGAYNALLNTTSKRVASVAACLTILSYMATAVISASEAIHYAHSLWHGMPVMATTIALLALFAVLSVIGIGESAKVAVLIFITHLTSLVLLLVVGGLWLLRSGTETLSLNLAEPVTGSIPQALFLGFSAAMLGISGFESSANFVEEQDKGVFPKTLRNMWLTVGFFNPAIALLALSLVPLADVGEHREALLSHMGRIAGGDWLAIVISVDASLVLSGAVLTSFVGVVGLMRRMTLDRCLPQNLLVTNRRGTSHRIILGFFVLCVSVLLLTKGELGALAGVYTLSFLAVMALFGIGNILLKVRRRRLPRPERASWFSLFIGITAVLAALIGNATMNPKYVGVFLYYFLPTMAIILIMLGRIGLLNALMFTVRSVSKVVLRWASGVSEKLRLKIEAINGQQVVFFTRGDSIASLNRAMLYVKSNEHTNNIKVVLAATDEADIPDRLEQDIKNLDEIYPQISIDFEVVDGDFGPDLINELSAKWDIPQNFMFIGSPGDRFPYGLADLGGVRLII